MGTLTNNYNSANTEGWEGPDQPPGADDWAVEKGNCSWRRCCSVHLSIGRSIV